MMEHARATTVVVDLDDTLLRGDMLVEQLVWLGHRTPLAAVRLFVRMLARDGRAEAKATLARACEGIPVDALPYRQEVLDLIHAERARGATVILATATHRTIAERIAAHLGVFDQVLATEGWQNLKGTAKLAAIQAAVGDAPFAYLGDAEADRPIFEAAADAIMVAPVSSLRRNPPRGARTLPVEQAAIGGALLRLMRPHHWVKNLLVFLPILAAQRVTDVEALVATVLAAGSFSLMASAIYCANDLHDLDADRRHHRKRRRPLASGMLPVPAAVVAAVLLPVLSLALAHLAGATWVLVAYAVLNVTYTLNLKQRAVIDVLVLAMMYAMRVVAGGVATGILLSGWLIGFSLFLFLSLALAKRHAELAVTSPGSWVAGRGYTHTDLGFLMASGLAVSMGACVVLALYVRSPEVATAYLAPEWLWIVIPLVLYWLMRLWLIAGRAQLHDDPLVFAMRDKVTWLAAVMGGASLFLATRVPLSDLFH